MVAKSTTLRARARLGARPDVEAQLIRLLLESTLREHFVEGAVSPKRTTDCGAGSRGAGNIETVSDGAAEGFLWRSRLSELRRLLGAGERPATLGQQA